MIVGGLYFVLWGRSKEDNQALLKTEPLGEKGQDVETGWPNSGHHIIVNNKIAFGSFILRMHSR